MNKPRLIDANELYKLIEENSYMLVDAFNSKDKGMFLIGIKEAIDKTPTAYDVKSVVEQLGKNSFTLNNGLDCVETLLAMELVKKGGVADEA